ncbi:MAG: TIGR01777 family oxidoreductase [Acidimicrobiia bacterium]|nr:TIGR01777 family oxidoreductase [Acidimicrobiia bacterium]
MRVAVSGSHGLIGSALLAALAWAGHDVVQITRPGAGSGTDAPSGYLSGDISPLWYPEGGSGNTLAWDPEKGSADAAALSRVDAVVHLAGAPIGDRRWRDSTKATIRDSRARGTHALATAVAEADPRPGVFVSGSAVGFYGNRDDTVLTEESPTGDGFLASVCRKWEAATAPAVDAGVRVAHIRTGIVLSAKGGTLGRILPLFRLGLGGRLGSGNQWFSWIGLDDEVRAILHVLDHDEISGPVNLTAPTPVTNRDFTKALGSALGRPVFLPVPPWVLHLALGREMADELVLGGQRVLPEVLTRSGFEFTHPDVEAALLAAVHEEA